MLNDSACISEKSFDLSFQSGVDRGKLTGTSFPLQELRHGRDLTGMLLAEEWGEGGKFGTFSFYSFIHSFIHSFLIQLL